MSKKLRCVLIVMLLLLAAAVTGYLLVDGSKRREEQKAAEEQDALHMFRFDVNNVDTVEIQNEEGTFTITRENGAWTLTDTSYAHEFLLSESYVNTVCSYMSSLTAQSRVLPQEGVDYGFGNETAVTCTVGNEHCTVYIGGLSALGDSYYAKLPEDDHIYCLDTKCGEALRGGTALLKSPYMLNMYDVKINYIKLESGSDTVWECSKDESGWQMHVPLPYAAVDNAQMDSLLTVLTRTEVDEFLGYTEELSPAEYGLDKIGHKLTVKTDEQTVELDFAEYEENDGMVYFLDRNTGQITGIETAKAGFLQTKASELLSVLLPVPVLGDMASLEVTSEQFNFTMEQKDGAQLLDSETVTDSTKYESLYTAATTVLVSDVDESGKADLPEDAEPVYTLHITKKDGTDTMITLLPTPEEGILYAFEDGNYTGMKTEQRVLTSALKKALAELQD